MVSWQNLLFQDCQKRPQISVFSRFLSELKIDYWLILGFTGQVVFFARFVVQWLYSEKHKKSLVPIQFWYLSILGALIIFTYAVKRRDPVFFTGQFFAILIYLRNLYFIRKEKVSGKKKILKDEN